jgi:O-acetyl-ADP-ribose deacetylase (regulator of RNase III)
VITSACSQKYFVSLIGISNDPICDGNLLEAHTEALVNTVNEVGVMGRGVALMFSEVFPENTRAYIEACRDGKVHVGRMFVTENNELIQPRWIINFPTKKHWRSPSRIEWIHAGLEDLSRVIKIKAIKSIALPPLGCGNGGLDWSVVRQEIESAFSELPNVEVLVYSPTRTYQNVSKKAGLDKLTPARALISELVRRYAVLGLDCTNLEVQKLAWFLQKSIRALGLKDPLDLQFTANKVRSLCRTIAAPPQWLGRKLSTLRETLERRESFRSHLV